ncbi:12617_t:CDS:2, partial [Racocetra persica]
ITTQRKNGNKIKLVILRGFREHVARTVKSHIENIITGIIENIITGIIENRRQEELQFTEGNGDKISLIICKHLEFNEAK